jgi:hypothetical protein
MAVNGGARHRVRWPAERDDVRVDDGGLIFWQEDFSDGSRSTAVALWFDDDDDGTLSAATHGSVTILSQQEECPFWSEEY